MIQKLIDWAVDNPLLVFLFVAVLVAVGGYAFFNINVEAYPDPAPAIIEVVAQMPGASAEEMERQITIPIEVALAGMPGLDSTRSKSMFGLSFLRNQFDYGVDYEKAKQEVINRLSQLTLPNNVTPVVSPASPIGEIYRYTIRNPNDSDGKPIYTLADLKALQDWTLQREFLRVPRVGGVVGFGGVVKRYEVHPDPDQMRKYGITLSQIAKALNDCNTNVGGDVLVQGETIQVVRGIGLLGGGKDPMQAAMAMKSPQEAAAYLRTEERRRLQEIRQIVVTAINNVPICIDQLVDGGPARFGEEVPNRGVVVGHQTRQGQVSISTPRRDVKGNEVQAAKGKPIWDDEEDAVQAIVVMRKGKESRPALHDVEAKIKELNESPGRLLPGIQLIPYYNRTHLIGITTETVRENLLLGMALVTAVLLMFLSNIRTALIVAINIPLALLFAFATLYLRGKSANLLSIGAVDFGIIVDSTVIMVENIFRHASAGNADSAALKKHIAEATREVQRSLFFSTIIMVCAMLPLFTMKGPEGQIFGPMADTYAFALGGALLLALTLSPVICSLAFRNMKPAHDNFIVRGLKHIYLWQLDKALKHRAAYLGLCLVTLMTTLGVLPVLGREFMPELEEGNMWIRGTFRINISLENVADQARTFRLALQKFPEVEAVVTQIGRPDDGTDTGGLSNLEAFVPLRPETDWPIPPHRSRPRTKSELTSAINSELSRVLPGIDWDFSQMIRDNVMEAISGVKGENSVKIFGPDLDELERMGNEVVQALRGVRGVEAAGVYRIKGQSNLEFAVDRLRCQRWGVSVGDIMGVIETSVGGKACTQMREGEKAFDITLRFPHRLRADEEAIKNLPVDLVNRTVTQGGGASLPGSPLTGPILPGVSPTGTSLPLPAVAGSMFHTNFLNLTQTPQRRLGDLITPLSAQGVPDSSGHYVRPGASTISRDQGRRFIAIRFAVKGRDLASTVAEAQENVKPLIAAPYTSEWGGEFQEMQDAEERLLIVVSISLVLIFILLYMALHSFLDSLVVYANVAAMSLGGIWALLLTGTNFNISAAVGFISILGVAVQNGLLLVSSFNQKRSQGIELRLALSSGLEKRVRPVAMTVLTAILGLLPAALSTRIGAQSQRPLAIVVVGGMIMTLLLLCLVPVLYSLYGDREPQKFGGGIGH